MVNPMADVVVTQEDREAADQMLRNADLVTLDRYEQSVAEAFARHRAQARKQALEEAAKVALEVDWGGKTYDAIRAI